MTAEHPIAVFLKARWDEIDPDDAHHRHECDFRQLEFFGDCSCRVPELTRRDIESKREIVSLYEATQVAVQVSDGTVLAGAMKVRLGAYESVLRLLAEPYSDHADYSARFKPETP